MSESVESAELFTESRHVCELFNEVVEPHRMALWHYCRTLTQSPWDGEDLFQETMLKAFATIPQLWSPLVPRTYLFRIATNTWIDLCRKRGMQLDVLDEEHIPSAEVSSPVEVREAIETLISYLHPRQAAIFLLMDVFEFSAREVAGMVRCTEGAAYSAVQRARRHVKALRESSEKSEVAHGASKMNILKDAKIGQLVVEQIVHALNTGDVQTFLNAMSEHIHNDAAPGFQEFSRQEVRSNSGQDLPSGLRASYRNLWGQDVILVLAETEHGLAIHNIAHPVVEGGQLVYFRAYYFCKELLFEVGRALGIPVQTKKPAVEWA